MGTQFSNLRYALESDRIGNRVAQHDAELDAEHDAALDAALDAAHVDFFDSPPHAYDRDCELAIRLEPGATEPQFEHDLSAGASLHSLRDVAASESEADTLLVPTGVAFGLPAYLSGVVHGFGVETAFLNAYDRTPLMVRLYADLFSEGVQKGDVVAKVTFVPILRPRFSIVPGGGARNPDDQERQRCDRAQNDDVASGGDVERV